MLTTTVAGRTWDFSHAIGKSAKVGNGFTQLTAVAVASGGVLYVLSRGGRDSPAFGMGRRIGKLTMDEEFLGEFADEDFVWPVDLALDSEGNVYCSDEYRNLVAVYDSDGKRLGQWGVAGSEEGQIRGPSGIAFDAEDNLYVVDSFNDRVQKFTKDGKFLMGWGSSRQRRGPVQQALGDHPGPQWRRLCGGLGEHPGAEVHGRRTVPDEFRYLERGWGRPEPPRGRGRGQPGRRLCDGLGR